MLIQPREITDPKKSGQYFNANDNFGLLKEPYDPATADFSDLLKNFKNLFNTFGSPSQPAFVIWERPRPWYQSIFDAFFYPSHHTHYHNHYDSDSNTQGSSHSTSKRNQNEEKKENNDATILGAILFFLTLTAGAAVAVAASARSAAKMVVDLAARRKILPHLSQLLFSGSFGFLASKMGSQLGAYYGVPLFESAAFGAALGGPLAAIVGASLGLMMGKYVAKVCVYLYTLERTNSDPYTLYPLTAQAINKQFLRPSTYPGSKADLMLNYILNKIKIAEKSDASDQWKKTLISYKQDIKAGEFPQRLKTYFDNEWITLVNALWAHKQSPLDHRFEDMDLAKLQFDLAVLAVITHNEANLQNFEAPYNHYSNLNNSYGYQPAAASMNVPSSSPFRDFVDFVFPSGYHPIYPNLGTPSTRDVPPYANPPGYTLPNNPFPGASAPPAQDDISRKTANQRH